MAERITRQDRAGLAVLTLNRAEKLNALDTQAFEELALHLGAIAEQPEKIGRVALRGNGRAFCGGADLTALGRTPIDPRFKPQVVDRIGLLPQLVIAAVHGVCLTGGLELALACDFIIADRTAHFADTHGNWGLVGAWGISQRLPRRIGISRSKHMMMTSKKFGAAEAFEFGLIDLLADEGKLDELLSNFVGGILENSWHTNFKVKRFLRETQGMSLAAGLAYEHFNYPGFVKDHEKRVSSFKQK